MSKHTNNDKRVPIEIDNVSITRDDSKCILCGSCKSICKFNQGVYGSYNLEETNDKAICINCGQCSNVCPTNAITEISDYQKVKEIIKNKDKIVIFQTSPSVRVALGEMFDLEFGSFVEGKMVSAIKKIGANYIFDTTFGADLTIMEEANELISRIKNKDEKPMFTSCCPAWVKFLELFYPEFIPNLSTTKSPILMQGSIIKTFVAQSLKIDPKNIINVAVSPCTAKKYEIKRSEMNNAGIYYNDKSIKDMDYIITTRELAKWLKEENIDFNSLENSQYDSIMSKGSGSGLIFGNSGGVMEAALRTAYFVLKEENMPDELLNFSSVRGLEGIKEAEITINDINLKLAIISGTNNARKILDKIKSGEKTYDFIEVMACLGGCIAGGGQPKFDMIQSEEVKKSRSENLYKNDNISKIRFSHENPEIIKLYNIFLNNPNSHISKQLLHTKYQNKSEQLNKKVNI